MGVPAPSQVVGTSAGDCRRKEGGRLVVVNGVLLCACEGAGARLSQVVPLTCASSIEGQRPRSSPSECSQGGPVRQPQRLAARCRDVLCLLLWQEAVFIRERVLSVACSSYLPLKRRREHRRCRKTRRCRAWR